MHDPGLFDLSDHLECLSQTGDPLEALDRHVYFEVFRPVQVEALAMEIGRKAVGPLTIRL